MFAGLEYYATGGMNDFIGSFDNQNTAAIEGQLACRKITKDGRGTWFHIYDTEEMEIVEFSGCPFGCGEQ
ncbi:hypothetical protein HUU40_00030 [candidate division KSB1 bacterium]|nr:hypothetical protein [candidate division KSB1 bacterium]